MTRDSRKNVISASELGNMNFPSLKWLLKDIIPLEGVTLIVSPTKAGKSSLVLNILCNAAMELPILGTEKVERTNVLYLDLENSLRRAQFRIRKITGGKFPPNIDLCVKHPRIGEGGEDRLCTYLENHSVVKIIVIDVLEKFRPDQSSKSMSYSRDAKDINTIGDICKDFGITAIIIHHTRKQDSKDWVDMISGTNAITGSCDTVLYLERERNSTEAILHATGRDIEEENYELHYDKATFRWRMAGKLDDSGMSKARKDILDVVKCADGPLSPIDIARMLNKDDGAVRRLIANMEKDNQVVRCEYGMYVDRLRR